MARGRPDKGRDGGKDVVKKAPSSPFPPLPPPQNVEISLYISLHAQGVCPISLTIRSTGTAGLGRRGRTKILKPDSQNLKTRRSYCT